MLKNQEDTICALATAPGSGAIAVIRVSGEESLSLCESVFTPKKKGVRISEADTHTIHFGTIGTDEGMLDEVLVSVFRKPHSYTGEEAVEISCHGSEYIQQKIIELMIQEGARLAEPGEFTLRAFLNGKFDLSQAEAVADLIAASSKYSHDLALEQMRGGFSGKIMELRARLVNFTSLIELELDFSEEDLEFANREELLKLLKTLGAEITSLISSFSYGNVIKTGIPVAIIGKPNVGKSTLLNAILNEERAIVSEIPGTTRDTVEDTIVIGNYSFRFIDTAGLRKSRGKIETIGIGRTYEKISQAGIILYVFDVSTTGCSEIRNDLAEFKKHLTAAETVRPGMEKRFIFIANKTDLLIEAPKHFSDFVEMDCIFISAKRKENINLIPEKLVEAVKDLQLQDRNIVSNVRHYEALNKASESIDAVISGLKNNLPTDLLTIDIRNALFHLGEITGEITTDEILGNIFANFCVGK